MTRSLLLAGALVFAALQVDAVATVATGPNALLYTVLGTLVANVFGIATLWFNAWSTGRREDKANARADAKAKQDREWLMEDRVTQKAHSDAMTAKLTTTETMVSRVAADSTSNLERHDATQELLAQKVAAAEALAMTAIYELKRLMAENTRLTVVAGDKADQAFREANHVNSKISDINKQLLKTISLVVVKAPAPPESAS